MDIKEIDKNFIQTESVESDGEYYVDDFSSPFSLNGIFRDDGRFVRMPIKESKKVSKGVENTSLMTAGGRLRFSTDSSFIDFDVQYDSLTHISRMTLCGIAGFTICKFCGEREVFVRSVMPEYTDEKGYKKRVELLNQNKMTSYVIYFPLYNMVNNLRLGFEKGSHIEKGKEYKSIAPIVYYGSSITQGSCASRPDLSYESLICKENNVDFVDLGFSGWAKGERTMAEYMTGLDASIYVMDYDHNASLEGLMETHYKFYSILRKAKPDIPVIMITKPDYVDNDDCKKRIEIIEKSYNKAVTDGDKNVYFVNGKELFKGKYSICTVDGCHPNDTGFYFIAEQLSELINKILFQL